MNNEQTNIPVRNDVIETPKDQTYDGTITKITVTTWREHLKDRPESLEKFAEKDRDKKIIYIEYTTAAGLLGNQTIRYYAKPSDRSVLGKFLIKYNQLLIGTPVKVHFDGEGNSSILVK